MKIKQELINNLVDSDWTREKLAEEVMLARYLFRREQAESRWLDQLADMLRDGEGAHKQKRIYDEYQDRLTDLMDTHRDRNNES